MTFKELPTGSLFEFDHSDMQCDCNAIMHGPWQKLSPRTYVPCDRATRESWGGNPARVGSAKTRVVVLTIDQTQDGRWHCGKR